METNKAHNKSDVSVPTRDYQSLVQSVKIFADGAPWNYIAVREALIEGGATFEKLLYDALSGKITRRLFPGCVCPLCNSGKIKVYSIRPMGNSQVRYVKCDSCGATDKSATPIRFTRE